MWRDCRGLARALAFALAWVEGLPTARHRSCVTKCRNSCATEPKEVHCWMFDGPGDAGCSQQTSNRLCSLQKRSKALHPFKQNHKSSMSEMAFRVEFWGSHRGANEIGTQHGTPGTVHVSWTVSACKLDVPAASVRGHQWLSPHYLQVFIGHPLEALGRIEFGRILLPAYPTQRSAGTSDRTSYHG